VQEGGRSWRRQDDTPRVTPRWTVPPEGWVKLNSDAGYRPDTGEASTGVVIRDSQGKVLLSAWRPLRHVASIEEA
jgi:hypothetical protein